MIDDKGLIRVAVDEFYCLRQVPFENQDVVSELEILQQIDASVEVRAQDNCRRVHRESCGERLSAWDGLKVAPILPGPTVR